MPRSLFAITMSRFESSARKNGHSRYMRRSSRVLAARRAAEPDSAALTAEPKPYQPGSATRHWPQEKVHGMARKSLMAREAVREAGREPMLRPAISRIGVAA